MKKIFAMAAIALFMVSCSDDDSTTTNEQTTKLVKVIDTDSDGVITRNLTYDGNKLIEVNSNDGEKQVITYTGNLITEWKTFDADNQLMYKDIYQYNSQNQLVTYYELFYDEEWSDAYKTTYTHNSNGTISFIEYYGEDVNDLTSITEKESEGIITDTTLTTTYTFDEEIIVLTYTFDGKNSPSKNITGMDKIGFAGTLGTKKFYSENVVSQSYSSNGDEPVVESTTVYTYNDADFPLTETETQGSDITTSQYIYE